MAAWQLPETTQTARCHEPSVTNLTKRASSGATLALAVSREARWCRTMNSLHVEPLILALDSSVATLDLVGGKGASLARMAAAGLPVPPGFHLTTCMYRRFVDENHLAESILSAAAQAKAEDPATL